MGATAVILGTVTRKEITDQLDKMLTTDWGKKTIRSYNAKVSRQMASPRAPKLRPCPKCSEMITGRQAKRMDPHDCKPK